MVTLTLPHDPGACFGYANPPEPDNRQHFPRGYQIVVFRHQFSPATDLWLRQGVLCECEHLGVGEAIPLLIPFPSSLFIHPNPQP